MPEPIFVLVLIFGKIKVKIIPNKIENTGAPIKSKENEPIEIFVNKVATKAKIPLSKMPQPFFFTKFIITLLFVTY